jgi:topoisomerase-4 subunit B
MCYISTKSTKKMSDQNQYTEDNIIARLGRTHPYASWYVYWEIRWWFFSWWWNLHSLKEVDNCIDEFVMGAGKTIEVTIRDKTVNVRDYGRGISWESHWRSFKNEYRWKMTLGFKKSVGLNGVGTKAVNALSNYSVWNQFVMRNSRRIFSW